MKKGLVFGVLCGVLCFSAVEAMEGAGALIEAAQELGELVSTAGSAMGKVDDWVNLASHVSEDIRALCNCDRELVRQAVPHAMPKLPDRYDSLLDLLTSVGGAPESLVRSVAGSPKLRAGGSDSGSESSSWTSTTPSSIYVTAPDGTLTEELHPDLQEFVNGLQAAIAAIKQERLIEGGGDIEDGEHSSGSSGVLEIETTGPCGFGCHIKVKAAFLAGLIALTNGATYFFTTYTSTQEPDCTQCEVDCSQCDISS